MSRTSVELTSLQSTTELSRPAQAASLRRLSVQPSSIIELPLTTQPAQYEPVISKSRTWAIISSITLITFISTMLNGATTVALPRLAADLETPPGLLLWPSSIQALTCGCTLLISGSLADALGARFIYLVGCVLQVSFILGCGLARTTSEFLIMRGLSGVAISFCIPAAVAIVTKTCEGKTRNLAFASMGGGQPIGFSVGLTLGGVLTDGPGWRWAFHIAVGVNVAVLAVGWWGLPRSIDRHDDGQRLTWQEKKSRLMNEVDLIGALIGSLSLGLLSYVFSAITGSTKQIEEPSSIAMLSLAFALVPAFVLWVGRQERLGRPAIIPNSLWKNKIFTTICVAVFLTWGTFNSVETILTFYFQDVQHLSATQASVRFLPAPVTGFLANVVTGFLVHRVPANWMIFVGCVFAAIAPLVMVPATPDSSYWSTAFLANALNPVGADCLFTISNLLITSVFPAKTQALAGGVFNSISQFGKSVGLALTAVIAASVTAQSSIEDKRTPEALMKGYHATFWYNFALVVLTLGISIFGLRNIGMVGHKRD